MRRDVIIDTNVLVALLDERDKWHQQAVALYQVLRQADVKIIYLDIVFNESISLLARRLEEQKRSQIFGTLMGQLLVQVPKENITWASLDTERLFDQITALIGSSSGTLNFHDSLIALVAREQQVQLLASFDKDFDSISWLSRVSEARALSS